MIKDCGFCFNSWTDPGLTPDNDLSYIGIGTCESGYNISLRTGDLRPTAILFEDLKSGKEVLLKGIYVPKFCPECGRYLMENERYFESKNNK